MSEKKKEYPKAMEGYVKCISQCQSSDSVLSEKESISHNHNDIESSNSNQKAILFFKELKGEAMLRIAILKKEMGAIDQAMQMVNQLSAETFGESLRANALCLKVVFHGYKVINQK
jgi:hypothetical protein